MSERFVSPEPPPNEYEREVLNCLIEEAAEVIQRATKMLRFGVHEVQPGQPLSNRQRLSLELGDMEAVLHLAAKANLIDRPGIDAARQRKHEKLRKFMQTEPTT